VRARRLVPSLVVETGERGAVTVFRRVSSSLRAAASSLRAYRPVTSTQPEPARRQLPATHIDSHRHLHAMPGILPVVAAVAHDAAIHVVRRPLDRISVLDPVASAKMLAVHAAWRAALAGVAPAHRGLLARAPHFRGMAMQGMPDIRERLLATIDQLPIGATEIMVHPGYDDEVLAAQDAFRAERAVELKALCDPAVIARLKKGDVKLVSFKDFS